jgi:hypothetical protein
MQSTGKGIFSSSVHSGFWPRSGFWPPRTARTTSGGRMLSFAGRPIGEPVARYGPFVMNTEDELRQAVDDYRTGRLIQL